MKDPIVFWINAFACLFNIFLVTIAISSDNVTSWTHVNFVCAFINGAIAYSYRGK